jgi:hypothetical protein
MDNDIELGLLTDVVKSDCIFYARMVWITIVIIILTCLTWMVIIAFS